MGAIEKYIDKRMNKILIEISVLKARVSAIEGDTRRSTPKIPGFIKGFDPDRSNLFIYDEKTGECRRFVSAKIKGKGISDIQAEFQSEIDIKSKEAKACRNWHRDVRKAYNNWRIDMGFEPDITLDHLNRVAREHK